MSTDLTPTLTVGSCQRLNSGDKDDESLWSSKPTLQLLSIKKVTPNSTPGTANAATDRYRIIISDGQNFLQAMLATQLNHLVEEDRVGKNTIAVIENMSCQTIQEKRSVCRILPQYYCPHHDGIRLVIILGIRVLQRDAAKVGNPSPLASPPAQQQQPRTDDVSTPGAVTSVPSATVPQQQNRQAGNRINPIYPIVALTPYQNNWCIKARVVQKSDIRHYSNQRGEGRFFSVNFMDESGEIKGTAWNAVVDDLFEKLQENQVYFVSKARVNLAKKKFSTLSNDYELSLDRGTEIEEVSSSPTPIERGLRGLQCHDVDVPVIRYNFVNLSGLSDLQKEAVCGMPFTLYIRFTTHPWLEDVIVIVKEVGDIAEITTRNNKTVCPPSNKRISCISHIRCLQAQKRDLVVVDSSQYSARLTLWGKQAEQFGTPADPVVAFKGVRVSDFNGKWLSQLANIANFASHRIRPVFVPSQLWISGR